MVAGGRLYQALRDAGLERYAGALAKNEVNDVETLEALTEEDLEAIVGAGNAGDARKLRAVPQAGAAHRLHKALREAGLGKYVEELERNEITDVETLDSLTAEDWEGMLGAGNAGDKLRFDMVISMLSRPAARRRSSARAAAAAAQQRPKPPARGWDAPGDNATAAAEFSAYTTQATEDAGDAPPATPPKGRKTASGRKKASTGKRGKAATYTPQSPKKPQSPQGDDERAQTHTYHGKPVSVQNRPPWRAPGCPQAASGTQRTREGMFSPLEDLIFMEKRRILWRKLNEILTDPMTSKLEKDWAKAVGGSAAQGNPTAADLQASAVGGKYTGPMNLTGSKWLLKPQDTVRVLEPSRRLHRAMGSVQAKAHPHTPLMCGKVGAVVSLQDVVLVKFADVALKVPPEALELIATKHVREQQVEAHVSERFQEYLNSMRDEAVQAEKGARRGSRVEEEEEKKTASNGGSKGRSSAKAKKKAKDTEKEKEKEKQKDPPAHPAEKRGASPPPPAAPAAAPPQQAYSNPRATHRRELEGRLDALQADLEDARRELAEAQAKNHRQDTVQLELKDLLGTFTSIARTLSTSSTWWAQQLAAAHPQSAALAAEVSNANTQLTKRLEDLQGQLRLP
eukprot:TRINITY_DN2278_c0_g1_i1.p1 TRINITY_DN2278_c0_g1~~TRINITY_DN2278_c0_g1_i1.p1  ORF type:complete len:625 (+),score=265.19 TRINITY_DN2278_c0_g1_i1:81-1955(+)